MKDPKYQYSGNPGDVLRIVPPLAVPGIVAASALAAGLEVLFQSWGVISVFISIGFVFLLGMSLATLCRRARCRSVPVATALGFVLGCFACYSCWVWFEAFRLPGDSQIGSNALTRFGTLFVHPERVWTYARDLAVKGIITYTRRGRPVSYRGTELWVGWSVDALWTVLGLTFLTRAGVTEEVFCESCGKWATPWENVHLLRPQDPLLLRQVKGGDFATALALEPDTSRAALPRLLLAVHRCEDCGLLYAWQLNEVKETSSRGSRSVSTSTISPFYVLSSGEVVELQAKYFPAG